MLGGVQLFLFGSDVGCSDSPTEVLRWTTPVGRVCGVVSKSARRALSAARLAGSGGDLS